MQRSEVQQMLIFVEAITRQPFPEGAADAWWIMLQNVEHGDAMRAVQEWFNQPEAPRRDIYPGYIVRRAGEIKRARSPQNAIEAHRSGPPARPNAEYLAARDELVRRRRYASLPGPHPQAQPSRGWRPHEPILHPGLS